MGSSPGAEGGAPEAGTPGAGSEATSDAGSGAGPDAPPNAASDGAPDDAITSVPEASDGVADAAVSDATAQTGEPDAGDAGNGGTSSGRSAAAYVTATVAPGSLATNGSAICMFGQPMSFEIIGTPTAPVPTTVINGGTQAGAPVIVTCSVKASGDGFDVQASATIGGDILGGILTIAGHVTATGGTGLAATFTSASNGRFSQASDAAGGCTITYTGDPPPATPAVAPGRIWGHIDCEDASRSDEMAPNPDGGSAIPRTCDAYANFLFENCGS